MFVDGKATINLMPYSLLKKIKKCDMDLRPHNMVLSNYDRKTSKVIEFIEVDIVVGTITRSTLFVVITNKANNNLLFGREWINGIWVVHPTLY